MFRKRGKKAQAAMEFLMTYGWAILIILIALGVLFYLGVFNPKTPSTCLASAPLTCADVKADGTAKTVTLVLGAAAVQTASIDTTVVVGTSGDGLIVTNPTGISGCTVAPTDIPTAGPSSIVWSCTTGTFTKDAKLSGTAAVKYTLQGSTQEHTTQVQFSGQVE